MDQQTLEHWRGILEGSARDTLTELYPGYMNTYFRFKARTGPNCPYCISVLKNLYVRELDRLKGEFQKRLELGTYE